jgi:hypothetical protein
MDTDIDGSPAPGHGIDIVGVITQYDVTYPYWGDYRLVPRSLDDILPTSGVGVVSTGPGIISRIVPNPARGSLRVLFGSVAAAGSKQVTFYDVAGRRVGHAESSPGETYLDWNAVDAVGRALPSGVYFAAVETAAGQETAKVVLIR